MEEQETEQVTNKLKNSVIEESDFEAMSNSSNKQGDYQTLSRESQLYKTSLNSSRSPSGPRMLKYLQPLLQNVGRNTGAASTT